MFTHDDLLPLAYKAERAASRKLAQRTGVSAEAALRDTLCAAAGDAGLACLVAARRAQQAALAARAAQKQARLEVLRVQRAARHSGQPGTWRAWFDGSAHPNPGRCGLGALLLGPEGQRIALSQDGGYGNSSEAEYQALLMLLAAARDAGAQELTVFGDSQVVINDVKGSPGAAAPSLAHLRSAALGLMAQLPGVALHWLPRHKNGEADALSQRAAALAPCMASMR